MKFFFSLDKIALPENVLTKSRELLKGAIDFHVHVGPDVARRRPAYFLEAAQQAKLIDMGALIIKTHVTSTVPYAMMATDKVGIPIFGMTYLNLCVEGLN